MESYTIDQPFSRKRTKWRIWSCWFCMIFGITTIGYAIYSYFTGTDVSIAWHLFEGILFFLLGFVGIFDIPEPVPEITLKEDGIEEELESKTRFFRWSDIEAVTFGSNYILLHLTDKKEEELDIWGLEYNKLQTVKEKLKEATKEHNISSSYKYRRP